MNIIKHFQQSMDQPGMVANPARGQLNKEDNYSFLVPVRWYHDKYYHRILISFYLNYITYLPLALYETDQIPDATDNF